MAGRVDEAAAAGAQSVPVYALTRHGEWISLREADGSGYLIRGIELGKVEATWVCPGGATGHEIVLAPDEFLHTHPEVARVPGVGAALRELAFPATASGSPTVRR